MFSCSCFASILNGPSEALYFIAALFTSLTLDVEMFKRQCVGRLVVLAGLESWLRAL